ncbi:MAG: hypothetical protein DRP42_06345 [Tenericutes bacterium]|nr:MAG: hypothetical protein DRP42_06345 [Mycoplasmatota bacterium]
MREFLTVVLMMVVMVGCIWVRGESKSVEKTFTWTATGDDGTLGSAEGNVLRMSTDADSLVYHFDHCASIPVTITPSSAGTPEQYATTIEVTEGVTYYFMMKAFDDAGNWSGPGNLLVRSWNDTIAPAAILDLNFLE